MMEWVVSTNRARCRDCYRCVRICPVKAVQVHDGQAHVVPELCVACANCVSVCPQEAKSVRDDLPAIREAIRAGRTVVASVAPSAPAYFSHRLFGEMEEALRALGFAAAGETSHGAEMIAQVHREYVQDHPERRPVITSSCPVVVNLIERYYPDIIPYLAPLVSPMVAHGRALRRQHGDDAYVVFIGPCVAKKQEMCRDAVSDAIDAALTFSELQAWMEDDDVRVRPEVEDLDAPDVQPNPDARLFPVEGGLVGAARMNTDILARQIVTTSGLEACADVLRGIRQGTLTAHMVELMACEGGCINGPVMRDQESMFVARQRIIEYVARRQPEPLPSREEWPPLSQSYVDLTTPVPVFTEEQIREIMHRVDKYTPEDELNCGACGYATCREKAMATLRGMAEATMCIPYMRRRAESLRQVVMDVTPNAILIVDTGLHIQEMSPSAETMLGCHFAAVRGKPLQTVMPVVDAFARVRETQFPILSETVRLRDDLVVEQTIVPVQGQSLMLGILRNVTDRERQNAELEHLRRETLLRTQEVVRNQMRVAQEIAQLLGETTAETKMMLSRLARLVDEGNGP
jgi:iron only hydrogenase large subunit-like protein